MKYSVLIVPVLILGFLYGCGPSPKDFASIKEPNINVKPKQKMLLMELTGNPEDAGKAVGQLFNVYFKLNFKGKKMAAPRARWTSPFNTPVNEWNSIWALPVGEEVQSLPAGTPQNMKIGYWEYGEVAEVLHLGPYEKEMPVISNLYQFISNKGYEISGAHEEEYIKGPGMFGPGNPKNYITIIRYEVKPKKK